MSLLDGFTPAVSRPNTSHDHALMVWDVDPATGKVHVVNLVEGCEACKRQVQD